MKTLSKWFRNGTEGFAALMLAAMFCTFLLQIYSRYVMVQPFGWTLELCQALWVWIVFFGCAFIVRDRDHVTFDILYLAVPPGPRKIFALLSAAAVVVAMVVSFLPTWDWIDFLRIRRSATLRGTWPDWQVLSVLGLDPGGRITIKMRTIYSIFALFMIVVALRYAYAFVKVLRHGAPDDAHEIRVGEDG